MLARWHRKTFWSLILAVALVLPAEAAVTASSAVTVPHRIMPAAVPTTPSVTLRVRSARDSLAYSAANPTAAQKLDPIPDTRTANGHLLKPNAPQDYQWLINLDNTGTGTGATDNLLCHPSTNLAVLAAAPAGGLLGTTFVRTAKGYPEGCMWPSIRYATASPAVSEGSYSDWNTTKALPLYTTDAAGAISGLPDSCDANGNPVPHLPGVSTPQAGTVACRYLVSVSAGGYQLGGTHFTVPMASPGLVDVFMNPYPIPLGTMRLRAFNDSHPTDGQFDHMTEVGLEGFQGLVNDVDGILQADFYGNALCTPYLKYQNSNASYPGYTTNAALVGQIILDSYGKPTPDLIDPATNKPREPKPRDVNGYYNPTVPGKCLSDSNGDITIPNLAPNHYSANVTPHDFNPNAPLVNGLPSPATFHWLQTTTLEGNHDHDVWVMPNDTGLDTELTIGGESVPFVDFGFVKVTPVPAAWATGCPAGGVVGQTSGCGRIKGQMYGALSYTPGTNGIAQVPLAGTAGIKLDRPIDRGWVALNNINESTGDAETMLALIPTDAQGNFIFTNVPDGDYIATLFDEPQDYILDMVSVTVSHGQALDMGTVPLFGWFSHIFGHVFIDTNGNGRQDPGEKGLFHMTVQNLNRNNNAMVGGINVSDTDINGFYDFKEAYPLGLMSINQFFNTRFKTTGITYQSCNDTKEHTVVAPMVDVSYLPLISQCGRLDWGVTPYNPSANGDNGGIVATMFYDQTRQRYNARQAQTVDIQTGLPGFRFEQYTPVKANPGDPATDPLGNPLIDPMTGYRLHGAVLNGQPDPLKGQYVTVEPLTVPDGANCASPTAQGSLLCYVSENNAPPAACYPRDANGNPVGFDPNNPKSLDFLLYGGSCVESAASSVQFGLGTDNSNAPLGHPVQTVDGNYTLGNGSTIPAVNTGDTLVRAVVPVDHVLPTCDITPSAAGCDANQTALHLPRKLYTYTKEEDVNLFTGAQYVPQGASMASLPWPPRANYFAGSGVGVTATATTLTDASLVGSPQAWVPNAFVGDQVKMGGRTATVTANSANTLTFTGGWSGVGAPPAGGPYTVRFQELIPGTCTTTAGCYDENQYTYAPGIDAVCAGLTHIVKVTNPDLLASGGSPLEGMLRHSCDMKFFNSQAGQSIAPNFHVHTAVDIPLPTHYVGTVLDDVSTQGNRKSTTIGDVAGIPGVPVGLYDWTDRRVANVTSDYNGVYEILMPAESANNCPVPAGTCPNIYRFVANDPGQPGNPNLNYNPNYRTISANFESWPNMIVPADNAPTRVVSNLLAPGLNFTATSPCGIKELEPQLFAVSPDPFTYANDVPETITIQGANFGTSGHVEFALANSTNPPVTLPLVGAWGNNQVQVQISANIVGDVGPGMLTVFNDSAIDPTTGKTSRSTSGLTFHVLGNSYSPNVIKVGPGKEQRVNGQLIGIDPFLLDSAGHYVHPFPIQEALDLAAQRWQAFGVAHVDSTHTVNQVANMSQERYLVVVYPNWSPNPDQNSPYVPLGTYFENLIIHSPVKLQGVGPGGNYADPNTGAPISIQGSIVDGRFFTATTPNVDIGMAPNPALDSTEPAILHWVDLVAAIQASTHGTGFMPASVFTPNSPPWTGQQSPLGEGAVITVIGTKGTYATGYKAAVDGFTISGGDQKDFPGNINQMGGGIVRETGAGLPGQPVGAVNTQGGAIYLNGGTDNFQITNNVVRQNSGSYGAIRLGTPFHGSPQSDGGSSHNYNAAISHNQIVFNGGTNLAGAVGFFSDSNNYSVDHNTFCMNTALEYGGAVSHFGFSPNGSITYNKMLLNSSVDEGGAIMVASEPAFTVVGGEQVADPTGTTEGSGPVAINHNYVGLNTAMDDGGGIRIMGTTGKGLTTPAPNGTSGLSPITITNNMFTNNISSHEGGAISMNDAPVVDIVNNTFSGNLTTATATTSNGAPAPAGISSGTNSAGLMALLRGRYAAQVPDWMSTGASVGIDPPPPAWPTFSSPLIENDIFSDNRAGSWTPNGIAQLGMPGDATAINVWDVGSVDGGAGLRVRYSLIYSAPGTPGQTWVDDGNNNINPAQLPGFVAPYTVCHNDPPTAAEKGCLLIQIQQMRTYFRFRPAAIVSVDLPDNALGDYHLANTSSPAHAMGNSLNGVGQDMGVDPYNDDIDHNVRPANGPVTVGAHEVGSTTPAPALARRVGAAPRAASVGGGSTPGLLQKVLGLGAHSSKVGLGGRGTSLAGILAYDTQPASQAASGLAEVLALGLALAALQLGKVAVTRRRKTVFAYSEEPNIEGGEEL